MDNVKEFSVESLRHALEQCYKHRNYKTIIVFNGSTKYEMFMDEISRVMINQLPGVQNIGRSANYSRICFKNGSCVHVLPYSPNSKGERCHLLLYDPSFDLKDYGAIFYPMIVKYGARSNFDMASDVVAEYFADKFEKEDTSSPELDEYLDGFKIIHNT